jgi:hypothetical protein
MNRSAPQPIYLGFRSIGPDSPPFMIAELPANHQGNQVQVFKPIGAAAESGSYSGHSAWALGPNPPIFLSFSAAVPPRKFPAEHPCL